MVQHSIISLLTESKKYNIGIEKIVERSLIILQLFLILKIEDLLERAILQILFL